jgi:hypothetical protein
MADPRAVLVIADGLACVARHAQLVLPYCEAHGLTLHAVASTLAAAEAMILCGGADLIVVPSPEELPVPLEVITLQARLATLDDPRVARRLRGGREKPRRVR